MTSKVFTKTVKSLRELAKMPAEYQEAVAKIVISLIGEEHLLYGSDIPHGDRDSFTVRALQKRNDIPDTAKKKILDDNPRRFYGL